MPDDDEATTVFELVGNLLQFIIQNRGEDSPDDVINAFQMAAAQIGCAFEKEVGEIVACQQLWYYKVRDAMTRDKTYGCGTRGTLTDLMRN